jgi:hypothetical protein
MISLTNRNPTTPLLHTRGSPKSLPTIALPDIPAHALSLLPKSKQPLSPKLDTYRSKVSTRRLPTVPMKSARDFYINTSSPIIYTPLPQPPHTSVHQPPLTFCSKIFNPSSDVGSIRELWFTLYRINPFSLLPPHQCGHHRAPQSTTSSSNDTTPIKSARYATLGGSNSIMSVVSMENMGRESESSPVVAVSRSVSAPRGLPRPVYSSSE